MPAPIVIEHSLQLGGTSLGLAELARQIKSPAKTIDIVLSPAWLDLSLLSSLALCILDAADNGKRVRISLEMKPERMRFLWEAGFFETITSGKSASENVEILPFLGAKPNFDFKRINYTPLLINPVGSGMMEAEGVFDVWCNELRSTLTYAAIAESDLIQSGELFFLLVWELLQNAVDHSGGRNVGIISQVFLALDWVKDRLPPNAAASIAQQFDRELKYSGVPGRKRWLNENTENAFVVISIADSGIGIPATVRKREGFTQLRDEAALQLAFDPDFSSRRTNPNLYDVHGLSQVLRIVHEYRGFLFVQSGGAAGMTVSNEGIKTFALPEERALAGTIYQVLVPVGRSDKFPPLPARSGPRATPAEQPLSKTLVLIEEIATFDAEVVAKEQLWPGFVKQLIRRHRANGGGTLFLDVVCCPPHRQFLSYVLRALRKWLFFEGVYTLNASQQIFTLARSFGRASGEFTALPLFQRHRDESREFADLCDELAFALSRGRKNYSLAIVLPITKSSAEGQLEVVWLGLNGLEKSICVRLIWILDYLFKSCDSGFVPDLVELALQAPFPGEKCDPGALEFVVRNTVVVNPFLFRRNGKKIALALNDRGAQRLSIRSLEAYVNETVLPKAKHVQPSPKKRYLYRMGWPPHKDRFRLVYYEMWRAISEPVALNVCTELLLRKAFLALDDRLHEANVVVSVTATAGLIGREIAARLGAEFWESPSVLELDFAPLVKPGQSLAVLVVCDLWDTGTSTERLIQELQGLGAKTVAILTLARDKSRTTPSSLRGITLISGVEVELGKPTVRTIEQAIKLDEYYEVDPHTLKPVEIIPYDKRRLQKLRALLTPLVSADAVEIGHFLQGDHHYASYFNLRAALRTSVPVWRTLHDWLSAQIAEYASTDKGGVITIVYPYYSAAYLLVNMLRREGIKNLPADINVQWAVAKPSLRPLGRLTYSIESFTDGGANGHAKKDFKKIGSVVILDDAVVTGATAVALVDESLQCSAHRVLALSVFDRIGIRPRRHLRQIEHLRDLEQGGTPLPLSVSPPRVPFQYRSYIDVNLPTHDVRNCPLCRVAHDTARFRAVNGLVEQGFPDIVKLLHGNARGSLTKEIPSRLTHTEIADLLVVSDALYGDPPTIRQIIELLETETQSAVVRLSLMLDMLLDRALDRRVAYNREFARAVTNAFVAPSLPEYARALFILHIPLFVRRDYARRVILHSLPVAFLQVARRSSATPSEELSLDNYFAQHPLEFCALSLALAIFRDLPGERIEEEDLDEWRKRFRLSKQAPTYSSIYYFELRQSVHVTKNRAVEKAKLLIYNFLGSYSGHQEAYAYRIQNFLLFLTGENFEAAKAALPEALFKNLLMAIRHIQQEVLPEVAGGAFTEKDIDQLLDAYQNKCDEAGHLELRELLFKHFASPDPIARPATITRLLLELAPNVRKSVRGAVDELKKWFENGETDFLKVEFGGVDDGEHVFCPKYLLDRTIFHLLRNPVENQLSQRLSEKGMLPPSGLEITLHVWAETDTVPTLFIDVIDNSTSQMPLEHTIRQGGGLSAQHDLLTAIGNDLVPSKRPDGRNQFRTILQRVYVNPSSSGRHDK